ncbi:MAG TPA: beta-ketoacyl-[acyl-carrier-protein] synthase II [Bacteroidetes bacterium]|nr:beta-ketoacyl-[acyl-carrier-protein] synthase II [Bacteroidota bacterium]
MIQHPNSTRVVVTGVGVVSPIGNDYDAFADNLLSGTSGAAPISLFDAEKFPTRFACEVKDFNPTDFIEPKLSKRMDRFTHLGIVASDQAIADANNLEGVAKERTAVIWSSGIGGLGFFEQEIGAHYSGDGTPRFNPFFIPKMIVDIAAGYISMRHGFRGPNYAPVAACASSTIAIIDAFHLIKLGKVDAVVCGGSDATITRGGIGGFSAMRALSRRNDDYKTASRPYDQDRDGFVMGEGGAALIVESLELAQQRGANILCEIVGTGMSADAYHLTAPHPDGEGAKAVMNLAVEEAGISPEQVDYINVHGTSTPVGDLAELAAIKDIWSGRAANTLISSTKSMTGHLLGAAGALEALALLVSMQQSTVPPTINVVNPDPNLPEELNVVFDKARSKQVTYALSNTFGFGGHNASVLLRNFE